jgi:hypothetical protein
MPVLSRPVNPVAIDLPSRKAKVIAETEVLVVGGGPAGLGAAIGAAEAGTEVILAEKYGFLGGNATAALVTYFMSFYIQHPERKSNIPVYSGHTQTQSEPIIAGAVKKYLDRLFELGGAVPPSEATGFIVHFDPEIFKFAAEKMLDQSGVKFLFHSFASGIIGDKEIEGVIFETKSGPLVIKAKTVIDCTGDGDIAAFAGAPYELGRESDGLVQPMTLMFRIAQFNRPLFETYCQENPGQWNGVHGLWELIQKATAAGKLNLPREDILFFATPHEKEVNIDSTRITGVLGVDVWDLTLAEYEGRRQVQEIAQFLKEYVPGFEDSYVIQSGVNVGVRETRRITGEYTLTVDDVLSAHKFEDIIARGSYPVDIHNPKGSGTILKHLAPGESYDIPLRCLIPQKIENLLAAGRCISGTSEALASYRIMPISMATGQAAGVCAALSVNQNQKPRTIEYRSVQKELLRQGANLRGIQI